MSTLRFRDCFVALLAACGHAPQRAAVENTASGPVTSHDELARVACGDASVTWLGDAAAGAADPVDGVREIVVQVGAESITWAYFDGTRMADLPKVTFSPDCRHAAVLPWRFGPYLVVATDSLVAYAAGSKVMLRYLDDAPPCGLGYIYGDLRWTSNTTVEYWSDSSNSPRTDREADITSAPTQPAPLCP